MEKDLIPKEELFFAITIVPIKTFTPDKMILQKDARSDDHTTELHTQGKIE